MSGIKLNPEKFSLELLTTILNTPCKIGHYHHCTLYFNLTETLMELLKRKIYGFQDKVSAHNMTFRRILKWINIKLKQ